MTVRMKMKKSLKWLTRGMAVVVTLWTIIGIFLVIQSMLTLTHVLEPTGAFGTEVAPRPILTLIHIVPGLLFMLLGPLQFVPQIRTRYLQFHCWSGRVFLIASAVIGVSALFIAFSMTIGGANETAATTLFAILFLLALGKAFYHIRRREIAQHREWMIRGFAIGLAVVTVRPIVGMFFGFSALSPQELFGIAFWLGFTIHLILAEVWINYTRARPLRSAFAA